MSNASNIHVTFTSADDGGSEFPDNILWKKGAAYVLGCITLLMTTLMIIGNGLVLTILFKKKSCRSPSNLIIGATSLNDLLTALLYLVFVSISCFTDRWYGGDNGFWCKFSATFALISMKVTFMNIAIIAIERLISIRVPLYYRRMCSSKRIIICVLISWLIVYTSGLLLIFLQDYGAGFVRYSSHYKQCVIYWDPSPDNTAASQIYSTFEISFNVSLLVIMVFCNGYVLFIIRYHVTSMNRQQECAIRNNDHKNFTPVYIRALTTTIFVVAIFVVSWIPYYIIFIILNQGTEFVDKHASALLTVFDISWWMTYIGPIVNPFLFAFRLESFRTVIKDWVSRGNKISMYELQTRTFGGDTLLKTKRSNQSVNMSNFSPKFPRHYNPIGVHVANTSSTDL